MAKSSDACMDLVEQPKWKGLNIYQRLLRIEQELGALIKEGTAPSSIGSFKFHTHTSVTAAIAPKLVEWNVAMIPSVRSAEESVLDYGVNSAGKKILFNKSAVQMAIIFRCADSKHDDKDSILGVDGYGTGIDASDKAAGKAISYAVKTAMLKVFKLDRTPGSGEVDNEAVDGGLDF